MANRLWNLIGATACVLCSALASSPACAQAAGGKPKPPKAQAVAPPSTPSQPPEPKAAESTVRMPQAEREESPLADSFPPVDPARGYTLGPGDVVRINVFQQPDMLSETRVSEVNTITVPLLGAIDVSNLSTKQAEMRIAAQLKARGLVREPYVSVAITQFRSRQVSVLGHVNRPGRYVMEEGIYRVTDALSLAGGSIPSAAADVAYLYRIRDGRAQRFEIDIPALLKAGSVEQNLEVQPGDTIFVDRAPMFYIYGEVQRPGQYRLEKEMTVMQALSVGGGLTLRASRRDVQVSRRDRGTGKSQTVGVQLTDTLQMDDVVYVKESLF